MTKADRTVIKKEQLGNCEHNSCSHLMDVVVYERAFFLKCVDVLLVVHALLFFFFFFPF